MLCYRKECLLKTPLHGILEVFRKEKKALSFIASQEVIHRRRIAVHVTHAEIVTDGMDIIVCRMVKEVNRRGQGSRIFARKKILRTPFKNELYKTLQPTSFL